MVCHFYIQIGTPLHIKYILSTLHHDIRVGTTPALYSDLQPHIMLHRTECLWMLAAMRSSSL